MNPYRVCGHSQATSELRAEANGRLVRVYTCPCGYSWKVTV